MWRSLTCPSTSRTLFSGLRVSTHGKQVAPYSVRFLLTSQEGGVGPILPRVPHGGKESLNLNQTDFKIPFNNFKPFINKYIINKWQSSWNETCFNKLKEIEPVVNHHRIVPKLSRRDEIILARLRIGHTRLTHSYLLKREERPYCIRCDMPFTVRHFFRLC